MVDIVDKLTQEADRLQGGLSRHIDGFDAIWLREAASVILSLRKELEEARAMALEEAASVVDGFQVSRFPRDGDLKPRRYPSQTSVLLSAAIRSLKETPDAIVTRKETPE